MVAAIEVRMRQPNSLEGQQDGLYTVVCYFLTKPGRFTPGNKRGSGHMA